MTIAERRENVCGMNRKRHKRSQNKICLRRREPGGVDWGGWWGKRPGGGEKNR